MISGAVRHARSAPAWKHLTRRWCKDNENASDVIQRCLDTVGLGQNPEYFQLLSEGRFLPAGRTLLTADPQSGAFPNCTVLPLDYDLISQVMRHTIGVGVNLDGCQGQGRVMSAMQRLGQIPKADSTGRKPGIMATLTWDHPQIREFIAAKKNIIEDTRLENPLNNMNISVIVDESQWQSFQNSDIFHLVSETAHACGDPGLLIRRPDHAESSATSPCGELWLHEYEVCNLGNINLNAYCDHETNTQKIDELSLRKDIQMALKFLDLTRSVMKYPLSEMKQVSEKQARLGLGVMGFADLLKSQGIKYGSLESFEIGDHIARVMREEAQNYQSDHRTKQKKRKLLALAPTGGTAGLLGVSYSIEPYFEESLDISPESHLKMQSVWQNHIDNGISKTVNLPKDATVDTVKDIYRMAFELGTLGVTVFRDGCRGQTIQPQKCSDQGCSL